MTDYEKLKQLIDEADRLIASQETEGDSKFQAWHMQVSRFLANNFGKESIEYENFQKTRFRPSVWAGNEDALVRACFDGLCTTRNVLTTYLDDFSDENAPAENSQGTIAKPNLSKVFIVHGHDGELKEAVARLIEKQELKPIILAEKTNEGKTIIEKIEQHSDVGAAICLFTPDDEGKEKSEEQLKDRARQNVVFEAGYFMGKLGRERIIIISEDGVELPSDMSGIVYTSKHDWKVDILKELKTMGFSIDFNKFYEG